MLRCSILALSLALSSSALAANEFERIFHERLPSLRAAFAPIALKRAELLELNRKFDRAREDERRANLAPIFRQTIIHPHQLMELKKAIDAKNLAEQETDELDLAAREIDDEFFDLEEEFRLTHILPLVNQYSWAIPNDEAIEKISGYGPLLEIGAGSGYWAHLLQEQGVDIVAYDDHSWQADRTHDLQRLWFSGLKSGNENVLLEPENKDRTLFICWPPKDKFAENALRLYPGSVFIYVGELPDHTDLGPAMGNRTFFNTLEDEFDLIDEVRIPNWPGYSDKVYIFQRSAPGGTPVENSGAGATGAASLITP